MMQVDGEDGRREGSVWFIYALVYRRLDCDNKRMGDKYIWIG